MDSSDANRGSFIVLEGTDGSGKTTQLKLLAGQLQQSGHVVAIFDFPQYELPSSYFVKRYLNGEYGSAEQVGPYTGALFYALDRYDIAEKIRIALHEGKVVLANRYTASSMAHQGAKFDNAEQRRGYFIWLDNLEFETLNIPRPDLNIVLRVPAETAQTLVDQKEERSYTNKKRDLHEADLAHLHMAVTVYDDLCQLFPKDFARIDCVRNGQLLKPDVINKLVREKVAPLLPKPQPSPHQSQSSKPPAAATVSSTPQSKQQAAQQTTNNQPDFFVPDTLSGQATVDFIKSISELRDRHASLTRQLTDYLRDYSDKSNQPNSHPRQRATAILHGLVPVVCLAGAVVTPADSAAHQLLNSLLPTTHTDSPQQDIKLVSVMPRNELDTIPQLLYSYSNLPFQELAMLSNDWNYEQKTKILHLFLNDNKHQSRSILSPMSIALYGWDLVTEYDLFYELLLYGAGRELTLQALSPRLGFGVPEIVDDANLTDSYETCFDLSLQLYSRLQKMGYDNEAQYAALAGHKVRWSVKYSARETQAILKHLQEMTDSPTALQLAKAIQERVAETHPIIADNLAS